VLIIPGETYKALVVYERLLDMHSRLLSDQEVCEDVWTEEFISVLHMNTSIAYKTVGNIDMALHYAQKYLRNLEQTEDFSGWCLHFPTKLNYLVRKTGYCNRRY